MEEVVIALAGTWLAELLKRQLFARGGAKKGGEYFPCDEALKSANDVGLATVFSKSPGWQTLHINAAARDDRPPYSARKKHHQCR